MKLALTAAALAALVSVPALTSAETEAVAPYARVFMADQTWTFPVSRENTVASTSTNEGAAHCRVESVETMCDRTVSNVVCDGEAHVLAGAYATTARGMWKVDDPTMATSHGPLPVEKRAFARFPASFVDASGKPIAKAFHGGWCTSSTAKDGTVSTICIGETQGFLGGSIAKADTKLIVGDVPRT